MEREGRMSGKDGEGERNERKKVITQKKEKERQEGNKDGERIKEDDKSGRERAPQMKDTGLAWCGLGWDVGTERAWRGL